MRIHVFVFLYFPNRATWKFTLFVYLPVHSIACLFSPGFTLWNTLNFSHLYTPIKSFSAAKESLLFEVIILFSRSGSLWHWVASFGDIQRVICACNFAVDNVTVGFVVTFYDSAYRSMAALWRADFSSGEAGTKLPPWADFHLRLGK